MRIKKFTLMTLALLVSMVSFAQKQGTERSNLKLTRPMELQTVPKTVVPGSFNMRTTTSAKPSTTFRADAVTPPAGSEPEFFKLTGTYYVFNGTSFTPVPTERTVEVIFDGNDVYISKICFYEKASNYVKGTINGSTVTFPKGQYFGNPGADLYFAAEDASGNAIDATATFDSEAMSFTFNETIGMWNETLSGEYAYVENLVVAYDENIELPLEPPTDLVTEAWSLTANDRFEPYDPVSKMLNIGFYGEDEVYIQGLCDYLPEAWIMGTREGNTITCATDQFYGKYSGYSLYFVGLVNENWGDVVFTYDPTANTLTTDGAIFLQGFNASGQGGNFAAIKDVVISKIVEKAATPATPSITSFGFRTSGSTVEFNIPIVDTDGNGMIADKLNYQLFYKDGQSDEAHPVVLTPDLYTKIAADMSVIPYTFTDDYDIYNNTLYLNMDWSSWTEMGIKSIYNGGDESHESPISWKAIERPTTTVIPQGLKLTVNAFEGTQASSSGSTPFTGKQLTVAISGDDIYIQGLSQDSNDGKAWVKGTKSGNTYVFKRGQSLGGNYYLIGYDNSSSEVQDAVLTIDTENGVYVMQNEFIVNSTYIDHLYYSDWYESNSTISINGTAEEPVTPPAGLETQDAFMAGYLNTGSAVVTKQNVKIGRDGNDVYVQGVFGTMPEAWAKGTFADENTIVFEPQLIAITPDYTKYYLVGSNSNNGSTIDPLSFSFRQTKNGDVVAEQISTFYSISTAKDKLNTRYYGYSVGIYTKKATETVPDQLTTDKYSLTYEDADKAQAAKVIEFGILDNKAYLKGISADAPNAWLVGDVEGTSIKFETPQALANDGSVVFINYDAANNKTLPYFELTWDATAKTLASVGDYVAIVNNKMITRPYYLEMMTHMNASVIADVAATPADPEFENMHFTNGGNYIGFTVKTISTTGEGLLPEKLFYKMYSKDEADQENPIVFTTDKYTKLTADMTEIPYGFEDAEGGYDFGADFVYLMMEEHLTWKQIGIQAIYKGGNAENTSNIVWYTIVQPKVAVLPEGAEVTEHVISGTMSSGSTGSVVIPANTKVKMAKVDNSIYIQGLQGEAWVRGNQTAENTYTFANGQYLGKYPISETRTLLLFLLGTDADKNVVNSTIQLNTTTNKYEFMTNILVNATYTDRLYYLLQYDKGCTIDVVETGISTVKADAQFNANAPAYNMAGQRVDKDFKGLVIKGGKKVVIK